MQFWPRNALAKMEQSKVKRSPFEIAAIDEDISFLNSMMTDRAAQYSSVDAKISKIDNRRLVHKQEGQRMKENQKKRQQWLNYQLQVKMNILMRKMLLFQFIPCQLQRGHINVL